MARLHAVLGDPVAHSLSPAIHGAAFRELGRDAAYGALRVRGPEVGAVMRALSRQAPGAGGNVTLPHKELALEAVDRRTEAAAGTGACNCFWGDASGRITGDNTDVGAFVACARRVPGVRLDGGRVLLLGAGGAARAVLYGCLGAGVERVDVLNRTEERARTMAAEVAGAVGRHPAAVEVLSGPDRSAGAYGLVVNATSLGLRPDDPLPLELDGLEAGAALDLVYGPDETPWVRHARALGFEARDGREMLLRQAGLSLRRWTGREPPLEAMRAAADAALEARRPATAGSG